MIYIKEAAVCTPYKILIGRDILVEDNRIKKITPSGKSKIPQNADILYAKGKIISPGFIDVHIQGAGGYDFLDGTPEALDNISQAIARFGTTSFLATTVFKKDRNPHIENIINFMGRSQRHGANCLGIHLEGPFVNPERKGMIRPDGIFKYSAKSFNRVIKAAKGRLKMMTIAPEPDGATEGIKKLRRKNIIASFGHSDAGYEETIKGINAGITHATHIFNAMRPMHHRDPGGLAALLTDERVSVQLIADGVHVHPAVIKLIVKLKGVKNIVLITDSMSSQGLPGGRYVYDGWKYESRNGACRYKDGTLIGAAVPLNKMVKRMVQYGGVNLSDAIQMATLNPARLLGIADTKGSIEEGKDADLVIMDKNLNAVATLVGGKIAYRAEDTAV